MEAEVIYLLGVFGITVSRSDIFNKVVPFVPFTKLVDGEIKGAHNGDAKDTK